MFAAKDYVALPICSWCREECEVPENTRTHDDPHTGEERTFCSRSCEAAHFNG